MKKIIASAILTALFSAHANAQNTPEFSLAQKTDAVLKQIEMQNQGESIPEDYKEYMRNQLMQQSAFANLARKEGLDKQPDVRALVEVAVEKTLSTHYIALKQANFKPTEAEVRAMYKEQIADAQEYHVRHILVDSEKQASELIAQLNAGASFKVLAKKYSQDHSSATKNGGDLDWSPLHVWIPEFKDAILLLQPKQMTQTPVKTQFGYHIIQLLELPRPSKYTVPFEEARVGLVEAIKIEYNKKLIQQAIEQTTSAQ